MVLLVDDLEEIVIRKQVNDILMIIFHIIYAKIIKPKSLLTMLINHWNYESD